MNDYKPFIENELRHCLQLDYQDNALSTLDKYKVLNAMNLLMQKNSIEPLFPVNLPQEQEAGPFPSIHFPEEEGVIYPKQEVKHKGWEPSGNIPNSNTWKYPPKKEESEDELWDEVAKIILHCDIPQTRLSEHELSYLKSFTIKRNNG